MDLEESEYLRSVITKKRWDLRREKIMVYAKGEDIHKNFYQVSELLKTLKICPHTEIGWCMCLIIHKIQRLINALENPYTTPIENFEDTICDLLNYIEILLELYVEKYNIGIKGDRDDKNKPIY